MDSLTPLTSFTFLDDDDMEQVEYEDQELEVHGLPIYHDTEVDLSVEGAQNIIAHKQ